MKNPYEILDVPYNASQSQINHSFKDKKNNKGWGNSDYENMQEFIVLTNAYKVLSNKAYRFLYDIKTDIPKDQRAQIYFESQKEVDKFVDILSDKISGLKSRSNEHLKSLKNQIVVIRDLSQKNESLIKQFSLERKKCFDMEETISDLLFKIDSLTKDLELSTDEVELVKSQKKYLEEEFKIQIDRLQEQLQTLEALKNISENQNSRILSILRNWSDKVFKVIAAIVGVFLLVIAILLLR